MILIYLKNSKQYRYRNSIFFTFYIYNNSIFIKFKPLINGIKYVKHKFLKFLLMKLK
jgi:hypothetical protein